MITTAAPPPPAPSARPRRKRLLIRLAVLAAALLCALVLLVQVALLVCDGWLASPAGRHWLDEKLSAATGFQITTADPGFAGAGTLHIGRLTAADAAGVFLDAKSLYLNADLPALAHQALLLRIGADTITLARLPASAQPAPPAKSGAALLQPFTMPDIYVRHAAIRLRARHVALDAPVAGQALSLSPDLSLTADRDHDKLTFALSGALADKTIPVAWLPTGLSVKGGLDTAAAALSIETLSVETPSLTFKADGDAGLNTGGNVTLRGELHATDLASLSANALGGAADLYASLSGATADPALAAHGQAKLTGAGLDALDPIALNADLDKILAGPNGKISISTAYQKRPVTFAALVNSTGSLIDLSQIALIAPDLSATGGLHVDTASTLATGALTLDGDLAPYKDLLKTDLAGRLHATVSLTAANGKQGAAVDAAMTGFKFQTVAADTLSAKLAVADIAKIWPDTASIGIAGLRLPDLSIARADLALNHTDAGSYAAKLTGNGAAQKPFTLSATATLSGTSAADAAVSGLALKLASLGGAISLNGSYAPSAVDMKLTASRFPLAALTTAADATLNGTMTLTGPPAAPRSAAAFTLIPGKQSPPATIALNADYAAKKLTWSLKGSGNAIHSLSGQGSLPLTFALNPFAFDLPGATTLNGNLAADLDLALLRTILGPDLSLRGRAKANASLAGTVAKPALSGSFSILNTAFEQLSSGVMLQDISATGQFRDDALVLQSLHAGDGSGGSADGHGTFGLAGKMPADLVIAVRKLNPFRGSSLVDGRLSADLALKGDSKSYTLKGTSTAGPMNISIPSQFAPDIPKLNIVTAKGDGKQPDALTAVNLDIAIKAPNQIFVRGWGLDAEFAGDLHAGGTLAAPWIEGTLTSRRGRFEQFGKRFDIDHANLRFQGTVPPSPYLDIQAETTTNDITGTITLSGAAANPSIKLTSTPALPEDQILSQILFGKDISSISPFQAIQIAQTIRQFSGKGGGGVDPLGKLRGATGLDDIDVNTSDTGATTVGAGKYITNRVYVSVQSGAAQNTSVGKVQVDVTPHIKLETKIGQDAQAGAGVSWQWDY